MAVYCLRDFFLVAVLVFSFGIAVSTAKKCSPIDIYNCKFNNANTNGCYYHDKIKDCINGLIDDCNDSDKETATEQLAFNHQEKMECPKLPDGQCFHYEMTQCKKDIAPYLNTLPISVDCSAMDKHAKIARDCLEKVKVNCNFLFGRHEANELLAEIQTRVDICDSLGKGE